MRLSTVLKIRISRSAHNVRKIRSALFFVTTAILLPEEKLNRISSSFIGLIAARSTSSGGAGLGLAIAKQIVELHNGTIVAESQEDQNKFSITLPLA